MYWWFYKLFRESLFDFNTHDGLVWNRREIGAKPVPNFLPVWSQTVAPNKCQTSVKSRAKKASNRRLWRGSDAKAV